MGRPCQSQYIKNSTYCHSTERSSISANGRGIPQSSVTSQTFWTQSNIQKNLQIGMAEKLYKVKNDHGIYVTFSVTVRSSSLSAFAAGDVLSTSAEQARGGMANANAATSSACKARRDRQWSLLG